MATWWEERILGRRAETLETQTALVAIEETTAANLERIAAARETTATIQATLPTAGLVAEGEVMSAEAIQTMRARGGFEIPENLKQFLPLVLIFILVVFIIIKK